MVRREENGEGAKGRERRRQTVGKRMVREKER